MDAAIDFKKRIKGLVWPLVLACVAIYFGVHLLRNDHGVLAMQAYDLRIGEAEQELAQLTLTRVRIERETTLLRPNQMHPDILGERARQRLNMGGPDEVLILRN